MIFFGGGRLTDELDWKKNPMPLFKNRTLFQIESAKKKKKNIYIFLYIFFFSFKCSNKKIMTHDSQVVIPRSN